MEALPIKGTTVNRCSTDLESEDLVIIGYKQRIDELTRGNASLLKRQRELEARLVEADAENRRFFESGIAEGGQAAEHAADDTHETQVLAIQHEQAKLRATLGEKCSQIEQLQKNLADVENRWVTLNSKMSAREFELTALKAENAAKGDSLSDLSNELDKVSKQRDALQKWRDQTVTGLDNIAKLVAHCRL